MITHDLEEKIVKVWNTTDDLDAVLHYLDSQQIEGAGIPANFMDVLMNMVIGIQALHERKSKMLFEEFEKVLKSNRVVTNDPAIKEGKEVERRGNKCKIPNSWALVSEW